MDILIIDDQPAMREEIVSLINGEDNFRVVGEAETGEEGIEKALALQPDVILMDLVLPGINGIEASRTIRREQPEARILAFSNHTGRPLVEAALMAGISGYVSKDRGYEELIPAIREVSRGGKYFGEQLDQ